MKTPGRSPSTMSLKEPRSKPDIKEEQKPSMMTGFLTDSNPLSVVSSVVNKFNPFDAKSDPGANQEENLKKQKEHEKIEDPREKVKPPHLLQQSPGHTQHSQHPQGPVKSTDTITPTQQQPSKSSQSGPKPIPLQQSTSKFPTQSSSTTKPSSHTPPPKEPLSHVKDPIKPVAQESKHTTSSSQFQGPKKETIKHDQSVTQGPMDMGKQNMQQSRPLTQSRYSSEVAKGPPHTTEPAKKLIKEPEKQPAQPQGPAKQIMQQAGPTGKTTQQATNMKQPIQQTLPLQQQTTTSMTSKQTAQKPEPSKPPETKQSSQSPRKPMPGLNQSAKMLPQQQDKFPEKIPEPKKQQQDSTQEMSKVAEKTMCPLCSTTELLLNTNEKANYNTCTQCHTTVCSLCGFNPNPDMTEIHEWLCLNCQMQRALGMDKNPPPSKPSPVKKKPASAVPSTKPTPESSQRKQSISAPEQNLAQVSKVATPVLTKQRSVTESPTSKSKKSFEPQTGNVPSKAELMEKPQQLSPENKQQQTKPEERVCDVPSSQVVPTKLDSLLPKVPSSPGKRDIDSKTRDTAKPEKSQLVEKLPVSQPVVQELHQSSASSTHPKLPPKPDTSKLEEDPKSSPSKINPNLNGKQVQKEAQVQPSPKPSPSHKPVVSQTMSHAQSEVQKDPLVQPSPKPSPSRKPVVPQTMSRTQPQVQKDSQALPSPKPSPSHKPVVPQSTSQVQPKVQKDPQVQPSPKPSPSHKPVIPQITSQAQPQVQKDPHVQPSPKPSPSHKPVIPQTTSQAQPQVQNDSNVQQSPKPSPSHKPVIPQTTSQAQPQVQNDSNVQQSPKPSPSHKPVVIQTMSQAQSQVQKDQKIQPGPKPSPSHKPVGPQATPQPQPDKSQGQPRRFSLNLGSTTETPKHQPTTPQGTVTGKLFGFGASIFSQASSFISTATQPSNQMQNTQGSTAKQPPSQQAAEPPTTAKDAMHDKQLHPPQKSSELPKTAKEAPLPKQPHPAQKTSELPKQPVHAPQSSKPQVVKKEAEPLPVEKTEDSKDSLIAKEAEHKMETKKETTTGLPKMEKIPNLKKLCPLCETELNIGSKDLPNFNTCTQCTNVVCNMCGFNPTPHLTEVVEWLCLNCQTHRAMTGQLVDLRKTSPPLGPPSKSSPKHTISLENQKEIHKVTTSSFTASHQSVTEVISKMSNEKVAMVPEEKSSVIPEEKISIGGSKKVDIAPEGIVVKASEEKADITPSLPVEKTGIVSEGKPSLIPVQLIEQEIDKDKLLLSLSEKVKKSVALPGEEVFPSKDINSLVPMEIKGIKPPEGKIMPKEDLMIDLSATLLKQIDEGTLENRIKPKPSQLIENEAGKEKTTKTLSGTQKKVKRTLPNPPPEEASNGIQSPYNTVGSVSRRRICRNTTMARAKILQDIDRELDLVERESSKLRKKQAELDEEEKEIDAKLRYLEMGINRRKEALLKEREKRERAYLQGVAEERDYMSDSEVSSTRPTRIESHLGLDRPQTAAPTEYSPYLTPQTQSETHFVPPTSPYTQFQYQTPTLLTQAPTQYSQQSHYEQPLYHQQVSSYQTQPSFQAVPTMSFTPQQPAPTQQPSYKQHQSQMILMQQKRQGALDLDCKLTTHYDVIRNQPLIITPASTDNSYSVPHLGSKYSTLDLRLGLDEKSSMASSPMSSISADSFYADLDHHTSRNYVLIDDIGELTKGSGSLSSAFGLHEKELSKADRILRSVDARRTPEVTDFLAPMTSSARLHSYGKADEDSMEDPYELKLLKHQIKQEFRRGTENLDPLVGYSPYYHSDSLYRHFPKTEKYSISRLTLEKQAAKQLPPAILYQKQSKHKKAVIDPKIAKFSPIQESRDIEPDYSSYLSSSTSSIPSISSKVRLLQDDITYGLRKNITDQQKFLGPALAQNLGASLSPTLRTSMQDEVDKPYVSGSRSRPSSRPSSIYGLDLSIKRDLSSSSLRLKANEAETLDGSFSHVAPSGRTKPSSLPISQSRGRIPIVAQNSEEESPLSPVGQPMGMARASAGPLPPISADSRDQFGSSHSLPEVQQHMREESRTRGYDRDIAFIMDDFQHAMSDSEENSFNDAYHLRREETDWFDKPRESRIENGHGIDRKLPDKLSHARSSLHHEQVNGKPIHYVFPHLRFKLQKDPKDHTVSGNGFGIRVVGGKEVPGNYGETGAYIAKILPGGDAEHTGRLTEGMQVLEWNGYSLTGKTYEDVQSIIGQSSVEAEICVRLDLNMLSNSETPQNLELHEPAKPVDKTKSPGVDPKQLAAELQKVSQQQAPSAASAVEKGSYIHSGTTSAASSAVPSPGQPGSPSVSKKRHSSKSTEAIKSHSHPITGEIQLQVNYDKHLGNLIIHILQARNLVPRDNNGYSDPFVKVYLLPGRGQVMVVQNASAEYKRRTKHVQKSLNPEWNQTVIYKNISMEQLKKKTLEVTIWDYDRFSSNDFLGEVLIDLSNPSSLDNIPRWYQLKEQSESIDHAKPHSSQSNQQVPKPSVIKSRSHGIFPDPSKDMQIPTIEKSHSSPGSSKSSSEGHLRSHGPSRSQSKTSVTQTHLEDAGAAIAAAEAAVQQLRLQPTAHKSSQSNHARKQHRHSIAGVLPIQRTQSDNLPPPANDSKDQSQLALKKVNSDGSVKTEAKSTTQKPVESSVSTASSVSSFGSGYSMDSDGSNTTGDSNLFPAPRIGKINQNGQDLIGQSGIPLTDVEGKTQVMGEIKIALKKEMKTDGEQLIVEILQCRNITYKFKSPDHLPDLYVKLYVINIATQKRIIKKKTRVCRHDREPSFNETFRFSMSPAGHSLQILLVSNGGKFMKKTLIGEAYIWLDKVDLRKRIVNWHKLLVSSTQTH
ncbi:protein piccolo [Spea bombifrons]|uniref:protein piccolo n=1 Tax=Spea bombifrons TaxID=233779 RepID=UPI00234993F2|nr:protein piccolo [Spea bombifrons]